MDVINSDPICAMMCVPNGCNYYCGAPNCGGCIVPANEQSVYQDNFNNGAYALYMGNYNASGG